MAGITSSVVASLQQEFQLAKQGLNDVDQNIRKITGREPGLAKAKAAVRRSASHLDQEPDGQFHGSNSSHNDDPKRKRFIAFSRLNRPDTPDVDDEPERRPTISSSVVANPRTTKPRTQALEEQKSDQKGMARNKRMFGMILGTLQRFQSEESRRKTTTQRRVEIEKKLEQNAEDEKIAVVKERKELFKSRRQKQAEIRKVEHKMERVEIHQEWEKSHQCLGGFIRTKTKPFIFYMPKKQNAETEKRLQDTKDKYRLIIAEKRAKVQKELAEIDACYKKEVEAEDDEGSGLQDTSGPDPGQEGTFRTGSLVIKPGSTAVKSSNGASAVSSDKNAGESTQKKELVSSERDSEPMEIGAEASTNDGEANKDAGASVPNINQESNLEAAAPDVKEENEFEPIYDE